MRKKHGTKYRKKDPKPWYFGSAPECLDIWTSGTVKDNEIKPSVFHFDNYGKAKKAATRFYWDRRKSKRYDRDSRVVVLQKRARPDIFGCEWYIVDIFDDYLVDLDKYTRKEDTRK